MIGKIEVINKKTDVKGRVYETVKVNGEWLINQEEELQGVLCMGVEYDLTVEESSQLRADGNPWPTKIKGILPVTDVSQPEPSVEPEEPSLDEERSGKPVSTDESIVRQVAYKVAGEAIKVTFQGGKVSKDEAAATLQDFAHVIAVDILRGVNWK